MRGRRRPVRAPPLPAGGRGRTERALRLLTGYVKVLSLDSEEFVIWDEAHEGRVWDVGFGPDGRHLVSAGEDGTACVWQLEP